MRSRELALGLISMGILVGFPYLLLSGSPTGKAAEAPPKVLVSILGYNSSQQVLYDYAARMDLAGIEALADANPTNPIPQGPLTAELPAPMSGWLSMMGSQYVANSTDATAIGMYIKGNLMSIEEMVTIGISHRVGGFVQDWDPSTVQGIFSFDQGYPKDVTVQGYPGLEWRATGENLGEITNFEGNLESFGGLFVSLGGGMPIPEPGFLAVALSILLLGAWSRARPEGNACAPA